MLLILGLGATAMEANNAVVTALYSSASAGYVRAKMPDGSFKPETYVVGNGGYAGGTQAIEAGDDVSFPAIVRLMAVHLASKNYLPARNAKSADLMLVVTWGRTVGFNDTPERISNDVTFAAMNNLRASNHYVKQVEAQGQLQRTADGIQSTSRSLRDADADALEGMLYQTQMLENFRTKATEQNARLLGYAKDIADADNPSLFAGNGTNYRDMVSDVENERYYVIISAYDYKVATEMKKSRVLWTTRISVQARGNRFRDSLATMLANAASRFGENSGRLIRQYHQERINLGELKFLETLSDSPATAASTKER